MNLNNELMSFLGIVVKSGNMSFGYNCVKEGVYKNKIRLILLTSDLSEKSKKNILFFLKGRDVEYFQISETMAYVGDLLGKASGILGISDENMALKVKSILISNGCSGRN